MKAFVDTGRNNATELSDPVVGDLMGTGTPVVAFSEVLDTPYPGFGNDARVTVASLNGEAGSQEVWSTTLASDPTGSLNLSPPTLIDLDGDGAGEVVALVAHNVGYSGLAISFTAFALTKNGTTKWETTWNTSAQVAFGCHSPHDHGSPGLGDLNGDGVTDIVFVEAQVVAVDGRDGHILFQSPLTTECVGQGRATVVDVEGDGSHEVFAAMGYHLALFRADGTKVWGTNEHNQEDTEFAIADLDLDGKPEFLVPFYRTWVAAFDLATGAQFARTAFTVGHESLAIGAFRQDGLPYAAVGNNDYTGFGAAFRPGLDLLWYQNLRSSNFYIALADVLGKGRPQVISMDTLHSLLVQDGRDGRVLLDLGTSNLDGYAAWPIVADADGDGLADIVIKGQPGPASCGGYWCPKPEEPRFPFASFVVLGSNHWKKMPKVWNTRDFFAGQVDEHLKFTGDYQPWKTHNTWRQNFYQEPARLLADLTVATSGISVAPSMPIAGDPATITATIRNVGGVAARNVVVRFFDGDPASGGGRIGETTLAGPLAVRTGTATATIPWTPYPDGEHRIFVQVNPDQTIEESGYEENQASARVFVKPGTNLSDVAVTSVAIAPAAPIAGTSANVDVRLANSGVRGTGDFTVAIWDGVPGPGSTVLGTTPVSDLAAGGSTSVDVPVVLGPGSHYLYAQADSQLVTLDADRSNNVRYVTVTAPVGALPDLLVAARDLVLAPTSTVAGRDAVLSATIHNYGQLTSSPLVRVYRGDPALGGQVLAERVLYGDIAPGGQVTFTETVGTRGLVGNYDLVVVVDPNQALTELTHANNSAATSLTVLPADVQLGVATDRASYGPNEVLTSTATLTNHGAGRNVLVDIFVESSAGVRVATIASGTSVPVGTASTASISATWSTGANAPGAYRVHAIAREGAAFLAEATGAFGMVRDGTIAASVTVDRTGYLPGQEALLRQRLLNTSANAAFGPLTTTLTVTDGTSALLTETRQVASVPAGASWSSVDILPISSFTGVGTFAVNVEVRDANGVLLASAHGQVDVARSTSADALSAVLTASPGEIGTGQTATFSAELTNRGNTALTAVPVDVLVRDATTLALEAQVQGTATLGVGQTEALTLPWLAAQAATGDKVAVLQVQGRTLARTLLRVVERTDADPPSVAITGLQDGLITNQDVTPHIAVSDASTFTATYALDGLPYQPGTPVTDEGDHVLTVTAQDAYANSVVVTVRFTIDKTAPAASLVGIAEGAFSNAPLVTLAASAQDARLASVSLAVDGAITASASDGHPFTWSVDVSAEGPHLVELRAVDAAGNESVRTVTFTLDRVAPVLAISGVTDGNVGTGDVAPEWSATDANLLTASAALTDGTQVWAFASASVVSAEGDYTLVVDAADKAGNHATTTVHFAIDHSPPQITIADIPAPYTASSVAPTYSVSDAHPGSVVATLNGSPFASGTLLSAEGTYTLVVVAVDAAGNTATQAATFAIDRTAPAVTIGGITSRYSNTSVTPTFAVSDASPTIARATLNGAAFTSGTTVTDEGTWTLDVEATDAAGNKASASATFTIDRTAPTITVGGVSEGAVLDAETTLTYAVTDLNLDPQSVVATLDGEPVASGATLFINGAHVLVISASDLAGNSATTRLAFEVWIIDALLTSKVRVANALVFSPCPNGASTCPVPSTLAAALGAAPMSFKAVTTAVAWAEAVRSGAYDVFISYDAPPATLDANREVVEQVRARAGLVVLNAKVPDADPDLAEALGAKTLGKLTNVSQVDVGASALGQPMTLAAAGSGALQSLVTATAVGTSAGKTVLSLNAFGKGRAAYLTFDPEASGGAAAADLLARILRYVTPAQPRPLVPLDTIWLEHRAENLGAARPFELAQTLAPASLLTASPTPVHTAPEVLWSFALATNAEQRLETSVRLPDAAGTFTFTSSLWALYGTKRSPFPPVQVSVTVPQTVAQLASSAVAALQALTPATRDRNLVADALARVQLVASRGGTTRSEAEANVSELVAAARDLGAVKQTDVTAARDAVDALLRAWEVRYVAF